jgi:hypothetical protein
MTTRADIQNFEIMQGDDLTFFVDVGPDDLGETLVGADMRWRVYNQAYGIWFGDPVIEKAQGDGIEIIDAVTLRCSVTLTHSDTLDLDPKTYYHEYTYITAEGFQRTPTVGMMTVNNTANRDLA